MHIFIYIYVCVYICLHLGGLGFMGKKTRRTEVEAFQLPLHCHIALATCFEFQDLG